MNKTRQTPGAAVKAGIVIALAIIVGLVIYAKNSSNQESRSAINGDGAAVTSIDNSPDTAAVDAATAEIAAASPLANAAIPRLVDLGAGKCIPCKMMAPILEELKTEYRGRFDVAFIDVWENRGASQEYGIRVIPTQIFYDADGKELFRHEGFFSKEDILAKWAELGVTF